MSKNFIFDVDGTLTKSREAIDNKFLDFFSEFVSDNPTYVVTGGSYKNTEKQLGKEICNSLSAVYNCNGAIKTQSGIIVKEEIWKPHPYLIEFLQVLLTSTKWKKIHNNNIVDCGSMVNFSIVGCDCSKKIREEYYEWDKEEKERETICKLITDCYPDLYANVGGQISIGIGPKHISKASILDDSEFQNKEVIFFGDNIKEWGNNYLISERIRLENRGLVHNVDNWEHTWDLLSDIATS